MNFLRHSLVKPPPSHGTPFDHDELPSEWGGLNKRLYQMFHADVLPTILRNFDRLSMAHGIEVRMPFMDWRLVTYVMSLPDSSKNRDGYSKFVARQAVTGLVPESIRLDRLKIGFNSPMPEWMNGPLQPWIAATLQKPNAIFDEIVDTESLKNRIHSISEARGWNWDNTARVWVYINLKWYMDRYAA